MPTLPTASSITTFKALRTLDFKIMSLCVCGLGHIRAHRLPTSSGSSPTSLLSCSHTHWSLKSSASSLVLLSPLPHTSVQKSVPASPSGHSQALLPLAWLRMVLLCSPSLTASVLRSLLHCDAFSSVPPPRLGGCEAGFFIPILPAPRHEGINYALLPVSAF